MTERERDLERFLTFVDRTLRDDDARPDSLSAAATTVAFLLALVISVAFPVLSYWPLLLLVLADPIVDRLRRRTRVEA